nr:MAG TPA: hypothetical protein [Caudoviricetes sp.]
MYKHNKQGGCNLIEFSRFSLTILERLIPLRSKYKFVVI